MTASTPPSWGTRWRGLADLKRGRMIRVRLHPAKGTDAEVATFEWPDARHSSLHGSAATMQAAALAALSPGAEEGTMPSGLELNKRTFMLFRLPEDSTPGSSSMPIGTAFGVLRPGLVLTADHVVRDMDARTLLVLCTHYRRVKCFIDRVESHPEADVAAFFLGRMPNPKPLEHFSIGFPWDVYGGYEDFPLAEDVLAYGFPMVGAEKPINPRMMKGHIQSKYQHASTDGRYRYSAYELSLPAFPGLSGASVFRDMNKRDAAIGIVTDRISYFTEQGGHETKAYLTLAAALHPIADWIKSL